MVEMGYENMFFSRYVNLNSMTCLHVIRSEHISKRFVLRFCARKMVAKNKSLNIKNSYLKV